MSKFRVGDCVRIKASLAVKEGLANQISTVEKVDAHGFCYLRVENMPLTHYWADPIDLEKLEG